MYLPLSEVAGSSAFGIGRAFVYQMPQIIRLFARQQWDRVQRHGQLAFHIEKGRRNPAASVSQNIRRAYSAACLRGGSSAPELWISATW